MDLRLYLIYVQVDSCICVDLRLIFVYKERQCEGNLFPSVYTRLHSGLFVAQFVLIGFFILKLGVWQAPWMALSFFYTLCKLS